jgi:hypothetical protein
LDRKGTGEEFELRSVSEYWHDISFSGDRGTTNENTPDQNNRSRALDVYSFT